MNKQIKKTYQLLLLMSLICLFSTYIKAQKSIVYNPTLDHFLTNKAANNTAAYRQDTLTSYLNYKNQLGLLSDIRDLYFDLSTPIKNKHTIGVKVYSEQETSLFTKTKLDGFYAFHLQMNQRLTWSMGAQVGAANIVFGSTNASSGGSAWNFDASFSTCFKWKKTSIGLTGHQLTNSSLRPIGYEFELNPYLNTFISHQFSLSPYWFWETGVEYQQGHSFSLAVLDNRLVYNNKYSILCGFGTHEFFSLGALVEVPVLQNGIFIGINYNNSFSQQNIKQNSFGLSMLYSPF